jgi:hypothetical protein
MTGRMWRNRKERAEAMDHLGRHMERVIATGGQDLDLSTSSGRVITAPNVVLYFLDLVSQWPQQNGELQCEW